MTTDDTMELATLLEIAIPGLQTKIRITNYRYGILYNSETYDPFPFHLTHNIENDSVELCMPDCVSSSIWKQLTDIAPAYDAQLKYVNLPCGTLPMMLQFEQSVVVSVVF